jgi:beta-alanine--pyruvate transaminase
MNLSDIHRQAGLTAAQLSAHWMPFTGNRQFKSDPRILVGAHGAYYRDAQGRKIFDGLSGLWTCGLGHGRQELTDAVSRQMATLDYAPPFQFAQPLSFQLAERIVQVMPEGLDHVFFVGSGSEAADTSLKMARAYWRLKGQGTKTRLIGRAKGYHGVNFGGISVGGGHRCRPPAAHLAARQRLQPRHAGRRRPPRERAAGADRAA